MTKFKDLIEPELLAQMDSLSEASVNESHQLKLTHNRFDLAFKLYYLQSLTSKGSHYREACYKEHIKAFSEGTFCEPHNSEKNSYEAFKHVFDNVFFNIKDHGFDSEKSLIPLATDGSILNGAHRAASAIYCKKTAGILQTDLAPRDFGYKFFKDRGIPNAMLDTVAQTFTEHAKNSFLAIVWPAAKGNEEAIESILSKVVYKKKVKLNYNGAHNLLAEAYIGEPWLGAKEKNYPGIKNKLVGCFPDFSEVRIFIFQADSLSDVLTLKDKIRDVFDIEKHAIHITDTQEETIRLGRLLLNENGVHFLNYAYPRKFTNSKRQDIPQFLASNTLEKKDVLFDDNLVMDLYGFHRCDRISYLLSLSQQEKNDDDFSNEFYNETGLELFDHPKNHFWFKGMKFISIEQVYQMKLLRRTSRDMADIKLIKSLIKNTKIREKLDLISCHLYFKKIIFIRYSKLFIGNLLRKTGLFNIVKKILN